MSDEKIIGIGDWDKDGNYIVKDPETGKTTTYESKEAYLETLYDEED